MFGIEPNLVFERVRAIREERKAKESMRISAGTKEVPNGNRAEAAAGSNQENPENSQGVTDRFFAPCEKEIAYYLVKFGDEMLKFHQGSIDYDESNPDYTISVADYIKNAMDEDGLTMKNRLYADIYNEYFLNAPELGKETLNHFLHHPDEAIAKEALGYIYDKHPITIKEFVDTIPAEETELSEIVPKLMYIYKSKVVDVMMREITDRIALAQKDNDTEELENLMKRFVRISAMKNEYSKLLKRLVL